MSIQVLKEIVQKAETWPEEAQEELVQIAREIEAGLDQRPYRATPEEVAGIDRGLSAAREERFVSESDVEAVLAERPRA